MKKQTIDFEKAKKNYEYIINNKYLTENEKVGAYHLAYLIGLIDKEEFVLQSSGKEQP